MYLRSSDAAQHSFLLSRRCILNHFTFALDTFDPVHRETRIHALRVVPIHERLDAIHFGRIHENVAIEGALTANIHTISGGFTVVRLCNFFFDLCFGGRASDKKEKTEEECGMEVFHVCIVRIIMPLMTDFPFLF